jgi:hypothetical protein
MIKILSRRDVLPPKTMLIKNAGVAIMLVFNIAFNSDALRVFSSSSGNTGALNHRMKAVSILVYPNRSWISSENANQMGVR